MSKQEKKARVIKELSSELEQFLQTSLDKKKTEKVKKYISELKNVVKNRDGLINIVEQLNEMDIIEVPESLKEDIVDIYKEVTDDYDFWKEFIFEVSGYIFELDEKLKGKEGGCFTFVCELFKKRG